MVTRYAHEIVGLEPMNEDIDHILNAHLLSMQALRDKQTREKEQIRQSLAQKRERLLRKSESMERPPHANEAASKLVIFEGPGMRQVKMADQHAEHQSHNGYSRGHVVQGIDDLYSDLHIDDEEEGGRKEHLSRSTGEVRGGHDEYVSRSSGKVRGGHDEHVSRSTGKARGGHDEHVSRSTGNAQGGHDEHVSRSTGKARGGHDEHQGHNGYSRGHQGTDELYSALQIDDKEEGGRKEHLSRSTWKARGGHDEHVSRSTGTARGHDEHVSWSTGKIRGGHDEHVSRSSERADDICRSSVDETKLRLENGMKENREHGFGGRNERKRRDIDHTGVEVWMNGDVSPDDKDTTPDDSGDSKHSRVEDVEEKEDWAKHSSKHSASMCDNDIQVGSVCNCCNRCMRQ